MDLLSGTDKALLQRAARRAEAMAAVLVKHHGPMWSGEEGRTAKREHDRLQLDTIALRALLKRLDVVVPDSAIPGSSG